MSEAIKDGGAAFPRIEHICLNEKNDAWGEIYTTQGMSLRDWFAAEAMKAIIQTSEWPFMGSDGEHGMAQEEVAEFAFEMAETMLAAREPKEDKP